MPSGDTQADAQYSFIRHTLYDVDHVTHFAFRVFRGR